MPMVIPLLAAVGSIGAGVAAMGAATTLAGSVLGGMMIAGGALGAIGAITGNKKLSQFGMVLGLVGGIGSLAAGAWSAGANELASETARESARFASAAEQAGATAGEAAAGAAGAMVAPASAVDALGGGSLSAADGLGKPMLSGLDSAISAAPPGTTPGVAGALPAAPGLSPPAMPGLQPAAMPSATVPAGSLNFSGPGYNAPNGGMLSSLGDKLKSGMDWATKTDANARLTQGGMQAVAMIGKSVGDQEAIKTEIALKEQAQQRARDRLNASIAPVKMPIYRAG